jgi:hypothetical protein
MFEVANPNDTQRKKAERQLKRLVEKKLATFTPPKKGGDGGTQPGRYRAATNEEEPPA